MVAVCFSWMPPSADVNRTSGFSFWFQWVPGITSPNCHWTLSNRN